MSNELEDKLTAFGIPYTRGKGYIKFYEIPFRRVNRDISKMWQGDVNYVGAIGNDNLSIRTDDFIGMLLGMRKKDEKIRKLQNENQRLKRKLKKNSASNKNKS